MKIRVDRMIYLLLLMSFRLEYPLISGRLLVNGNDFYVGNSSSNLSQLALKTDIPTVSQYVHPSAKQCSWDPDLSEYALKSDISNVKKIGFLSTTPGRGNVWKRDALDFVASFAIIFAANTNSKTEFQFPQIMGIIQPGYTLTCDSSSYTTQVELSSNGTEILSMGGDNFYVTGCLNVIYFS